MTVALLTTALLGAFQFQTPEGWTALSRCADEATLRALPEDVANDARLMCGGDDAGVKPQAALAVDLRRVDDKSVATFNAVVLNGEPVINGVLAASRGQAKPDGLTPPLKFVAFGSVCVGAAAGYYLFVVRRRKRRSA